MNDEEMKIKFEEIADAATVNGDVSYVSTFCPNQYVGTFEELAGSSDIIRGTNWDEDVIKIGRRVFMILESPHTDEFDGDNYAIGPANGTTGRNIRMKVREFCADFNVDDKKDDICPNAHLYLINAVQFQCSLGVDTDIYRDDIFTRCWYRFAKNNLLEILRNLNLCANDMVILACTSGHGDTQLRKQVYNDLESFITNCSAPWVYTNHPSWWHAGITDCNRDNSGPYRKFKKGQKLVDILNLGW